MKDLTTEQYRLIYEQPVYPKNLYAERAPYKHDEYRREVLEPQVRLLQERGIYAPVDERPPTPRRCPRRSRSRSTCRPTWSPNPPDSRLTARPSSAV